MSFIVAEKKAPHGLLVVVTDADIIGKKFEQGKVQLDLTQKFYQGEEKTEEDVKALFNKARHLHLTGKHAVGLGVQLDLVNSERILMVDGIPHAEVVIE